MKDLIEYIKESNGIYKYTDRSIWSVSKELLHNTKSTVSHYANKLSTPDNHWSARYRDRYVDSDYDKDTDIKKDKKDNQKQQDKYNNWLNQNLDKSTNIVNGTFIPKTKANLIDMIEVCAQRGVKNLNFINIKNIYDLQYVFGWMDNIEVIDISKWNVKHVKQVKSMFSKCPNLKSVGDLSDWNLANASDVSKIVEDCPNLKLNLKK